MPSSSVETLDNQIAQQTQEINDFNAQIATLTTSINSQQASVNGWQIKWKLSYDRYAYVKAKAKLACYKNRKKCKQCYDDKRLFPTSGSCYTKKHWDDLWNHFAAQQGGFLAILNGKKKTLSDSKSQLAGLKTSKNTRIQEREDTMDAKSDLIKSIADANVAEAASDPDVVIAVTEAEVELQALKEEGKQKQLVIGGVVAVILVIGSIVAFSLIKR